jgi:murein DD-endopeptidase MepM/ murein hydrolase activator NlpD
MPVLNATSSDYNEESFWAYPWGSSGTHKGVDIFARKNTEIRPAVGGLVLRADTNEKGGNYVLVLSSKWRLHYYAHLDKIQTESFSWVNRCDIIGTVGDSGNASGKSPHLHYSVVSLMPQPWRMDKSPQGWKKMFYVDPEGYITQN